MTYQKLFIHTHLLSLLQRRLVLNLASFTPFQNWWNRGSIFINNSQLHLNGNKSYLTGLKSDLFGYGLPNSIVLYAHRKKIIQIQNLTAYWPLIFLYPLYMWTVQVLCIVAAQGCGRCFPLRAVVQQLRWPLLLTNISMFKSWWQLWKR